MLSKLRQSLLHSSRMKKRSLQVIFDAALIFVAMSVARVLKLENLNFFNDFNFYLVFLFVLLVTVSVLAINGLYRTFLRYVSSDIIRAVVFGMAASVFAFFIAGHLFLESMPWAIPLIYGPIFSSLILSSRLVLRSTFRRHKTAAIKNIAIYGAGAAGYQLIQSLKANENYNPSVLIDDDEHLQGNRMFGVKVRNFHNGAEEIKKQEINLVLFAIPSASFHVRKKIFNKLSAIGVEIKTVPSFEDLVSGRNNITKLKDLHIEDFLGRDPVTPITSLMSKNITGKTVLVTGAGGSIGSELCRQIIEQQPNRLLLLDISELAIYSILQQLEKKAKSQGVTLIPHVGSVQDQSFIAEIFDEVKIDSIYQAAAYKHVPLMESNMIQALKNNSFGTLTIAQEAVRAKIPNFTLISTDKAVNPTNVMGASKRLAEHICQSMNDGQEVTCFSIVRFGNVLASSGSVMPLFQKQIATGGPITLTHPEITRYFMTITEAAQLVIQANSMSDGGGVFVLDMGDPIKVRDLAFKMAQLSGLRPYFETDSENDHKDIAVRITGLRPGEKMHEELSYGDSLMATLHPRIMRSQETPMKSDEIWEKINELERLIVEKDHEGLVKCLAGMTDYTPDEALIKKSKLSGAKN